MAKKAAPLNDRPNPVSGYLQLCEASEIELKKMAGQWSYRLPDNRNREDGWVQTMLPAKVDAARKAYDALKS